uniref:Protein FAM161A n=1 Tax=Mola mola TaxID=94237 RepID=A0A3Q3XFD5_MOLML
MASGHRTNALVTSCLKTPVDPHTKAPVASYERQRVLPCSASRQMDNRDYDKEVKKLTRAVRTGLMADRLDLSEIFFSNEEYYSKLEELKKAHLRTMAELENMYRRKLLLKSTERLDADGTGCRWVEKSHSAVELRRGCGRSDSSDEDEAVGNDVEKGLLFSPKEHIKNMWRDFQRGSADGEPEPWKHRVTVPKPFQMMLREDERRRRGLKTRSEVELENAELRRQLEELTECQKKFRASPVPAHVHLPLYEELQERNGERQRRLRPREDQHLRSVPKPFSFLERERLKKDQKQLRPPPPSDQDKIKPFKAKPVPKAVYAAATGEQMKEEQLFRSIKIQTRAEELLHSASMPPSMLARRLSERKKTRESRAAAGEDGFSHRPQINKEMPDFDASYRRFQKQLENHKEVKPTTACEPFELRTSQISLHRERVLADIEKEQSSPRTLRWPYISPAPSGTPNSSLCSSLSGSLELLRKVLERRKKAEEEEECWKERQRQREKKLQRVVSKRAQANDPHVALSQTCQSKLREFRRQELQRRKEYQQEIKEMRRRVKGRPLLLEQIAQVNMHVMATMLGGDAVSKRQQNRHNFHKSFKVTKFNYSLSSSEAFWLFWPVLNIFSFMHHI